MKRSGFRNCELISIDNLEFKPVNQHFNGYCHVISSDYLLVSLYHKKVFNAVLKAKKTYD